jgi:hypothetical protein
VQQALKGTNYSFIWDGKAQSRPTFRETYTVVTSSIVFNQGLPDKRFSTDWKGPTVETAELKRIREEFENTPPFRSDSAGTQARLDKMLAEADRQSKQLEASSAAKEAGKWGNSLLPLGLGFLGAALLAGAAYWKWRGR